MRTLYKKFNDIKTERLLIRELREDDYADLYEIFSDFEVVRYQQIPPMESMEIAIQATRNFVKGYKDEFKIRRSIILDGKMIGIVSLHSFDYEVKRIEVGFMLNKDYWGKGIMTEAAKAVIDYVSSHSDAKTIVAKPLPENIGSIKVCQKLGFNKIDHLEKSILNFRTQEYEDQLIFELKVQ